MKTWDRKKKPTHTLYLCLHHRESMWAHLWHHAQYISVLVLPDVLHQPVQGNKRACTTHASTAGLQNTQYVRIACMSYRPQWIVMYLLNSMDSFVWFFLQFWNVSRVQSRHKDRRELRTKFTCHKHSCNNIWVLMKHHERGKERNYLCNAVITCYTKTKFVGLWELPC